MTTPQWDPSVHKRRLRHVLRTARESLGLFQQDVAAKMDWSPSKVIRIEAGTVTVTPNDLRALLGLYGIDEPARVEELVASARTARTKSPFDQYKSYLKEDFLLYLAYETSASVIRNFEPLMTPGLLQTEEYAAETVHASHGPKDEGHVATLVELRLDRQRRLLDKEGLEFFFMLDESVIRRPMATVGALGRQLDHILAQMDRPNVHVHVVPFAQGMYRSIQVPYVVLEFTAAQRQPPVLFREYPERDEIMEGTDGNVDGAGGGEGRSDDTTITPQTYVDLYEQLEQKSIAGASATLIREARAALGR